MKLTKSWKVIQKAISANKSYRQSFKNAVKEKITLNLEFYGKQGFSWLGDCFNNKFVFSKYAKSRNLFRKKKISLKILNFLPLNIPIPTHSNKNDLRIKKLNFMQYWAFPKLFNFAELPYHFELREKQLLRYSAKFFGYNYLFHTFSYTLWLQWVWSAILLFHLDYFFKQIILDVIF